MRWTSSASRSKSPNDRDYTHDNQSTWGKVTETAEYLEPLATAVLRSRDKLRVSDYAAITISLATASVNIYRTWARERSINLADYFEKSKDGWQLASYFVSLLAFDGAEINEQMVSTHKKVRAGKIVSAAWTATVDGVRIGWISPPDNDQVPECIWSPTPEKIYDIASKRMWERAGSDKIIRIQGERATPHFLPTAIFETDFLRTVEARAQAFLKVNKPRAMILNGPPGSGKSVAVGHFAKKLGFRTVIVNADELCQEQHDRDGIYARGVKFAEVLKPDVLIVNDIDRLSPSDQIRLLDIFDNSKSFARLIFATTNHYRRLLEPVRRPGRLDDLLHVPGLTLEEVKHIAPDLGPLAEDMVGWPIAYVRDMQDRFDVFGEKAYEEFGEVKQRLAEIMEDGKYQMVSNVTEDIAADTTKAILERKIDDLEGIWHKGDDGTWRKSINGRPSRSANKEELQIIEKDLYGEEQDSVCYTSSVASDRYGVTKKPHMSKSQQNVHFGSDFEDGDDD